jgi:hypothetical protein
MSAPARVAWQIDPLDVFAERSAARAYLFGAGTLELAEAVDVLQHHAERDGLVKLIGQDAVQTLLAEAFAPYRGKQ